MLSSAWVRNLLVEVADSIRSAVKISVVANRKYAVTPGYAENLGEQLSIIEVFNVENVGE